MNTVNIAVKDFVWKSMLNFSYNKNKLTRIENTRNDAIYYVNGGQIREGRPMNSLYSVRWAGLDEQGQPQAYDKDGNIVKSFADLKTEDLVYSGVTTPPYAASLSNSLQYKGISLSLLFTYYGGHVMRGVFGQYLVGTGYSTNMDKLSANFWRKPGDENNPETTPAFKQSANANIQNLWKAADKHIQKADYIKLNEIILAYQLPAKWIKNTFIKEMNMTFQVQNVWKWVANDQGLDPEAWTGITLSPSRGEKEPVNYTFGWHFIFILKSMMMNTIKLMMFLLLVGISVSCDRFLDIKPKGIQIPEYYDDYLRLLNHKDMMYADAGFVSYITDDILLGDNSGALWTV